MTFVSLRNWNWFEFEFLQDGEEKLINLTQWNFCFLCISELVFEQHSINLKNFGNNRAHFAETYLVSANI